MVKTEMLSRSALWSFSSARIETVALAAWSYERQEDEFLRSRELLMSRTLRDAGAEVIYHGPRKSPEHIARIAVDEGVDAVGLSILSGSHRELVGQVVEALRKLDAGDIKVFVGGTIPASDVAPLESLGVRGVYTSEQPLSEVIERLARELA